MTPDAYQYKYLTDRPGEGSGDQAFVFVLGHNHGDHSGAMPYAYEQGMDIYMCDRVGPAGGDWSIQEYNKKYTSANAVVDTERTGSYTGDKVHLIDEAMSSIWATVSSR